MSLQLRLFNVLCRTLVKPLLRREANPKRARRSFTLLARLLFRPPPFSLFLPASYKTNNGPERALWVSSGRVKTREVLLYFHGGGYIAGSTRTHRAMLARLSRLTGLQVFLPNYGLAPESPFPAAFDDAMASYDALLTRGYKPSDIIVGGDSAGGGLALAVLAKLCQQGRTPRAAFAFSPWTDLLATGASLRENAQADVLFSPERIPVLRDMVVSEEDADDTRISPLYAEFPNCPPVFFQASESEILRDDTLRMAARLREFGAEVTDVLWPDVSHVWQLFDGLMPEARAALLETAGFIHGQLET
ncbi:alpha/beta hydrolase [Pseudohalocynthiibacter aestuariivivens]|uniref:Alpha/beta hydrolase n=1 Tax=Pseudohalocynthiibacter aestuariivivens TaxID=1591409 RepID=A0ABV5JAL2_9RHOB|nr:alpha/beta hydrolase [Pseudohalocynthiibacter aestuariivivens]MBS9715949.1 alpha/beta hydrolase [Pseudohalocynthiibacter aestuariivivens]